MQEPERRPEARAVPQGERAETMGVVTPMMRGAYVPAWYSRVSWGGVLAGVLIAIGAQLVLSSIGVLVGFGTATVTNITDLRNISAAVGIWTAISALIALFIGAWAASSIGSVQFTSDGLWHGAT
ncbi:MAG TPA: hypothetical protein VE439_00765, partial [Anaerolineae bacterium]|nr:hypothetical protein [Anaerolineae bacterium]